MLSMTATKRAVSESSYSRAFTSPLPTGGWAQPAGVEGPEPSCSAGRAHSTQDNPATGIRGRRPTSSLDRWTG